MIRSPAPKSRSRIASAPALDGVAAEEAEIVRSRPAMQRVRALAAHQPVVARVADQHVVAAVRRRRAPAASAREHHLVGGASAAGHQRAARIGREPREIPRRDRRGDLRQIRVDDRPGRGLHRRHGRRRRRGRRLHGRRRLDGIATAPDPGLRHDVDGPEFAVEARAPWIADKQAVSVIGLRRSADRDGTARGAVDTHGGDAVIGVIGDGHVMPLPVGDRGFGRELECLSGAVRHLEDQTAVALHLHDPRGRDLHDPPGSRGRVVALERE